MARPALFRNRKFVRLSRLLGAQYRAVGILEMMWAHAYEDGDPCLGTPEDVEFAVGWDGDAGACASALVESNFLDRMPDGALHVHDLHEHCPEYVRDRMRKKASRASKNGTLPGMSADVPGTDGDEPVNVPDESELEGPPAPASNAKEPEALTSWTFRTDGKEKSWTLPVKRHAELCEAFPALDMDAEMRKAVLWCSTNTDRRKTARGMSRFLFNWCSNSQNRPRLAAVPALASAAPRRLSDRDDIQRARALVGSHREPETAKRDAFAKDAPEWAGLVCRAVYDTHFRPSLPEPLASAFFQWERGASVTPPGSWRNDLRAAWREANADPEPLMNLSSALYA